MLKLNIKCVSVYRHYFGSYEGMAANLHIFCALKQNVSEPSHRWQNHLLLEIKQAELFRRWWPLLGATPLVRSITLYLLTQISSLTRWTDKHGAKFVTFRSTFNYALSMNYKFSIHTIRTNSMHYLLSIYFNT